MTTTPVTSARMVGRGGDLATLQEAFRSSLQGTPRAVAVVGEAGIEEFVASLPPTAVEARGQCVETAAPGDPYAPARGAAARPARPLRRRGAARRGGTGRTRAGGPAPGARGGHRRVR